MSYKELLNKIEIESIKTDRFNSNALANKLYNRLQLALINKDLIKAISYIKRLSLIV